MRVHRRIVMGSIFLIILLIPSVHSRSRTAKKNVTDLASYRLSREPHNVVRRMLSDTGSIIYNLFSRSTFKAACFGVPFYLLARPVDHKIQRHFYDEILQKNKNQPSKTFAKFGMKAGVALSLPIVGLDIMSSDDRRIRRGEIFGTGMLAIWGTKNLIKLVHTEANKRPCHERFSTSHHTRSYGGNPSGHMAFLAYASSFWTAEKGIVVGLPMTGMTALAGALLVTSNRHYLSQVIAGAFYGVVFGLAAHKVFRLTSWGTEGPKLSMVASPQEGLGFKVSYDF